MFKNTLRHRSHSERHEKPDYPDHPAPGGGNYEERIEHQKYPEKEELPYQPARGGANTPKRGIRARLREKFSEKPATREEIMQLELDTRREQLKSQKYNYKHQRPSAFARVMGSGNTGRPQVVSRSPAPRRNYGQLSRGLLDNNSSFGFGNSLGKGSTWGTGINSLLSSRPDEMKPKRMKKISYQKSGLEKMFSL